MIVKALVCPTRLANRQGSASTSRSVTALHPPPSFQSSTKYEHGRRISGLVCTRAAASTEQIQSQTSTSYQYEKLKGREVGPSLALGGLSLAHFNKGPTYHAVICASCCPFSVVRMVILCECFSVCQSAQVYIVSEQKKADITSLWSNTDTAVIFWARSMGCFFCQ